MINLLPPLAGFLICLFLWMRLNPKSLLVGGVWLLGGILYAATKTGGFRSALIISEAPPE